MLSLARKIFFAFLLVLSFPALFSLFSATAFASSLALTAIGNVDTTGKMAKTWYYTSSRPLLKGSAGVSAPVNITVGSVSGSTNSDANGNWSWQTPTAFSTGANQVTITSNGVSLSFSLVIGSTVPTSATTATATVPALPAQLPQTGMFGWTLAIMASGATMIFFGIRTFKKTV